MNPEPDLPCVQYSTNMEAMLAGERDQLSDTLDSLCGELTRYANNKDTSVSTRIFLTGMVKRHKP